MSILRVVYKSIMVYEQHAVGPVVLAGDEIKLKNFQVQILVCIHEMWFSLQSSFYCLCGNLLED